MLGVEPNRAEVGTNGPSRSRIWLGAGAAALVTLALASYGLATWPMVDDEVPSLVEMGLFHVDAAAFSVPAGQIGRLAKANLVWYRSQRWLLETLPRTEVGYRLPSLVYGVLTSAVAFALAARWKGLWFAAAVAIVLNGSQMFIFLSQVNRFYALPLLLLTLALGVVCTPRGGLVMTTAAAGLLAAITVLSHNITMAVFVLAFCAAIAAYLIGRAPLPLVLRSAAAAIVGLSLYAFYLRPLIHGWASTGNPTPVLISFAAHASMPVVALALFGACLSLARRNGEHLMLWWSLLFGGSLCFFLAAPVSWNPRYFVFFMPAMWVLAAHAMEFVARSVGYRYVGAAWYGVVIALLVPGLASHYQDGSRHDYRAAAAVLEQRAVRGQTILSDDAETISYYLPAELRESLHVRTKVRELPSTEFLLVARSNAWTPQPRFVGRHAELLAEISSRRFDQFSHILRVYRVAAAAR